MKKKIILVITGAFAIAGLLISGASFSNNVQSLSELKAAGQDLHCVLSADINDLCYDYDMQQWLNNYEAVVN